MGDDSHPNMTLGMHVEDTDNKERVTVCVFCPDAKEVVVVNKNNQRTYPLSSLGEGIFCGTLGKCKNKFPHII
ncbi:hypothetical protein AN642_02235 [Epulopiscium sp. SCG-B10WGA-EpuloA2]|nr:hypothetical protein AN642_02235 [Epulopiscium sp. SCG-B10WGA-EpuloA2]